MEKEDVTNCIRLSGYTTWCGKNFRIGDPLPYSSVDWTLGQCQKMTTDEFSVCQPCADAIRRML